MVDINLMFDLTKKCPLMMVHFESSELKGLGGGGSAVEMATPGDQQAPRLSLLI